MLTLFIAIFHIKKKPNFKKWFAGLSITDINFLLKKGELNWDNIEQVAREYLAKDSIRGVPKETWIEWFVKDIETDKIANLVGYKNRGAFVSSWMKTGRPPSIYQKEFANSYTEAVQKYRRIRTIELLTDDDFIDTSLNSKLYWIYINEFGMTDWKDLAVRRPSQGLRNCKNFFETLFREDNLSFEELENLKSSAYLNEIFQKYIYSD